MMAKFGLTFLVALLLMSMPIAQAEPDSNPAKKALAISQQAVGRTVGDQSFVSHRGAEVRLSDFRGKPLVLGFIYTSCAQSCPVVIETLADAVSIGRDALGSDSFNVAVIGFDAGRDNPAAMSLFAKRYGLDRDGWTFLSGNLVDVARLTQDVGFSFFRSPKGFDHLDQVTILDATGKIYGHVYGATFAPPLLVERLKELIFGTAAPWSSPTELWKKVKLFCTIYDPAADRYRFDYSLFFQLFVGATIILIMIGFVVRNVRRLRRRDRHPLTRIKA